MLELIDPRGVAVRHQAHRSGQSATKRTDEVFAIYSFSVSADMWRPSILQPRQLCCYQGGGYKQSGPKIVDTFNFFLTFNRQSATFKGAGRTSKGADHTFKGAFHVKLIVGSLPNDEWRKQIRRTMAFLQGCVELQLHVGTGIPCHV